MQIIYIILIASIIIFLAGVIMGNWLAQNDRMYDKLKAKGMI